MPDKKRLFFFCFPENTGPSLYNLFAAGVDRWQIDPVIERSNSNICGLELMLEGNGHMVQDGVETELMPGDLFILHFGSNHSYWPGSSKGWRKLCLVFRPEGFMPQILQQLELQNVIKVPLSSVSLPFIVNIYRTIQHLLDLKSEGYYEEVTALITKLLMIISREAKGDRRNAPGSSVLLKALRYAETHLDHPISVTDLANAAGCSRMHITRLFRKHLGITTPDWLIQTKMRYARMLLRMTNQSIGEVGEAVGFVDPYQFSASFRRAVGLSPSKYRKQCRDQ